MRLKVLLSIMLVPFLLFPALSYSQPPNVKAGAVERATEGAIPKLKERQAPPSLQIEIPKEEKAKSYPSKKIFVRAFKITGNKLISTHDLRKLVSSYEGRYLTISQIRMVADIITREYWKRGYITTRAYVPPQKVRGGVVEIRVVEGKLGNIKIEGNKHYRTGFIYRFMKPLLKKEYINSKDLERQLLILNEFPDLHVKAVLVPGEKPGTSDIVLKVKDRFPIHADLFYNNYGTRSVGRRRAGATIYLSNLFKLGGTLSATGVMLASGDTDDLDFWRVSYSLPIGSSGMKVGAVYTYVDYDADEHLEILDIEGKAETLSVFVNRPIIKTRLANLYAELAFDLKDTKDEILDYVSSKDHIRALRFSLYGDRFCPGRHAYFRFDISQGLGENFGGMEKDSTRSSRYDGDNDFTKLNLDLGVIQKLGSFYLILKGEGQWASDTLVTGEEFSLGGPTSVRAYPQSEYLGDDGYLVSAELRTPAFPGWETLNRYLQWAFFIDHGCAHYKDTYAGEDNDTIFLTGAGVGARINLPLDVDVKIDAAFPIGGRESSDGRGYQLYMQFVKKF